LQVVSPTPESASTLFAIRILPLAEGMEVYVDGTAAAVVVSPDKETRPLHSDDSE
jgi:hypothetical protein